MSAAAGCWPNEDQTLLLRAALLEPEGADAAWRRWRSRNAIEDADPASTRLLPLVFRNLEAASIDDSDLGQLKSAYRAAWVRNQLLFRRASEALAALHDAGIETVVLKGLALAVAAYGDVGVRPMEDIDVLVRWEDFERAVPVLARAGWGESREQLSYGDLRALHARHLQHRDGSSLDLHQFALEQTAVDDPFWAAAEAVEVHGVPTRVLCAADQLLHVAVHGARWSPVLPIRWIADAFAITGSARGSLDWDRLVAEGSRRRVTTWLSDALDHLVDPFGLDVPPDVVERLRNAPKGRLELWAHRASQRPIGGGSWAPVVLDDYVRRSGVNTSLRPTAYLQELLEVGSRRELAGHVARKTAQTALMKVSMRLAPSRVVPCDTCGRRVVRLRAVDAALCEPCSTDGRRYQ